MSRASRDAGRRRPHRTQAIHPGDPLAADLSTHARGRPVTTEAGAMTDAVKFFYDNAGWSYNPATETPEQGRERGARALAAAEARLKAGPYYVNVQPDDAPWDGDLPYNGPLWIVCLWSIDGASTDDDATLLGAIGSVACEEHDDYMRVIAAELALDYLPAAEVAE